MAYTIPTAEQIKARYPELNELADTRLNAVALEAARWVDEEWIEADYQIAIIHLTAHMLVAEGALDAGASAVSGILTSDKLGDASQGWKARSEAAGYTGSDSELAGTVYGQRFIAIRNANNPAVCVV
jgi:hypothetical protein